ncbi:cation-translocating P-type ATPase [Alkalibacter mobilis]|uniref:cation-translocating P-type ATPase n=1 Tax=Alkalibacter mobilis TaxID=2787712 RepID=UPI0018A07106|nr:HAD-IC family P-type ATPase [Alkalibacter mobilis]MBF7097436.1 HAD-IC family P-type ATPase [Alkalibacter mobilis]
METKKEYYQMEITEVVEEFDSNTKEGLDDEDAYKRKVRYGENKLESGEKVSAFKILLHNLNNIIVYLLIGASVVSFVTEDTVEGIAILIAVLIAVVFGFFTEYKAQKSVESLQGMIENVTKVLRSGKIKEVNAVDVVPGDIMFLEEGDSITADGRLLKTKNLACIESALTGESEAVEKDAEIVISGSAPLGDRINLVFTGSAVTRGNGYAIVTQTGMKTEMGRISSLIKDRKKEMTPLNMELDRLGKMLILFAAFCAVLVVVLGMVTGLDLPFVVQVAIILAIAAIPEAMPAVSTITLARGMKIMAEHKALVKSLPAVETLGSTSVICTDKTGTLTENQMTVKNVYLADGKEFSITGSGYDPKGDIKYGDQKVEVTQDEKLEYFIIAGLLSSNATLNDENGKYSIIGDPTEGALIVLGQKAGFKKEKLEKEIWRRIGELPFNSAKKYMVTSYEYEGEPRAFIKGAPDVLIELSNNDIESKTRLEEINQKFAGEGMRVLAIGELSGYSGKGDDKSLEKAVGNTVILGLVGIIDPPRPDVAKSIYLCQTAGIEVKMITGDHPKTASIIAEDIGLKDHKAIMTGRELDEFEGREDYDRKVSETSVFARVSPENKLQIVDALKRRGHTVAMTGDGVNDAPALNGADIGVAMGIRGTEVAKEAADMILTDDKFSTIVEAAREGRIIFSNIKKYVYFLFSCNLVEILTILLSIIFFAPIPILPLHILWLNLVVDIFPAMAMGFEPAEENIMSQPPRSKNEGLVGKRFLYKTIISGSIIGTASFIVFQIILFRGASLELAQSVTFTMMAVSQLLHTLNVRREKKFGLDKTLKKNKVLLGALILSFSAQLLAVYLPVMNKVMHTVPIDLKSWIVIGAGALLTTGAVHLVKNKLELRS